MAKKITYPTYRVTITKLESEWKVINKIVKESGKKMSLSKYVTQKISFLVNDIETYTEDITEVLSKDKSRQSQFYIPKESLEKLTRFSKKIKIPVSTILDRIIISPLLK